MRCFRYGLPKQVGGDQYALVGDAGVVGMQAGASNSGEGVGHYVGCGVLAAASPAGGRIAGAMGCALRPRLVAVSAPGLGYGLAEWLDLAIVAPDQDGEPYVRPSGVDGRVGSLPGFGPGHSNLPFVDVWSTLTHYPSARASWAHSCVRLHTRGDYLVATLGKCCVHAPIVCQLFSLVSFDYASSDAGSWAGARAVQDGSATRTGAERLDTPRRGVVSSGAGGRGRNADPGGHRRPRNP